MVEKRQRIEVIRNILKQIYRLDNDQSDKYRIASIEREAIVWLYERVEVEKYAKGRPHSMAARRLRKNGQIVRAKVNYDHAIPLKTLRSGLKLAVRDYATFRRFLRKYIQGVIITRNENDILNSKGLRVSMPLGSKPHDMMARYKAAKIKFAANDKRMMRSAKSST